MEWIGDVGIRRGSKSAYDWNKRVNFRLLPIWSDVCIFCNVYTAAVDCVLLCRSMHVCVCVGYHERNVCICHHIHTVIFACIGKYLIRTTHIHILTHTHTHKRAFMHTNIDTHGNGGAYDTQNRDRLVHSQFAAYSLSERNWVTGLSHTSTCSHKIYTQSYKIIKMKMMCILLLLLPPPSLLLLAPYSFSSLPYRFSTYTVVYFVVDSVWCGSSSSGGDGGSVRYIQIYIYLKLYQRKYIYFSHRKIAHAPQHTQYGGA